MERALDAHVDGSVQAGMNTASFSTDVGALPPNGARAPGAQRRVRARNEKAGRANGGSEAGITSDPLPASASAPPALRVHQGIDFLKVSFWVEQKDKAVSFLARLETRKMHLQETEMEEQMTVDLPGGMEWNLMRTGVRFYPFRLRTGDITLLISNREGAGKGMPAVRIEMGSLTCQTGALETFLKIKNLLAKCGFIILKEQVSEIHLAADFIGVDIKTLDFENKDKWISRARQFDPHYKNWKFTGLSLGRGDIMLRCYDKVEELRQSEHKQSIFASLWGVESYNELPVTRVEYQLRRPILREFKESENIDNSLDTKLVYELLSGLDSLWKYCTNDWSRFCKNTIDRKNEHQDRADISEFWEVVRSIVWNCARQYHRVRPEKFRDETLLRKQIVGLAMSVAAMYVDNVTDFESIQSLILYKVNEDLEKFYKDDCVEFEKRMLRKRAESKIFFGSYADEFEKAHDS